MAIIALIANQNISFDTAQSTIVEGDVEKQRYRCKACKKTFTDLTNTALYRTRRLIKWFKFIECMIEGYSMRKSAELVEGVSHVTLFYWRRKHLASLKQLEMSNFDGMVEMDETYFCTQKKDKERLQTENPANVAAPL